MTNQGLQAFNYDNVPRFSRIFPSFCDVKKIFYEGQISGVKGEFNEHHFLSSSRFRRLVKLEKPMFGALSAQVTGVKHPTRKVFLSRMAVDARRCQSAMICWPILPPRNTGHACEQPITDPRSTGVFFFGTCAGCENTMQNINMINMTLIALR